MADEADTQADDGLPEVVVYDPTEARKEASKAPVSKTVQKRIQQEVARRHDAERQRDMALEELGDLRKRLGSMETASMEVVGQNIDGEIDRLTAEVEEALEAGDSKKAAGANAKLAQAAARKARLDELRSQRTPAKPENEGKQQDQDPRPQPARLSPRSQDWVDRNPWFREDPAMHQAAVAIHHDLVRKGVQVDSDKYFSELNRRIHAAFPDAFDGDDEGGTESDGDEGGNRQVDVDVDPEEPQPQRQPARSAVAPATRMNAPGAPPRKSVVRLTTEEEEFAKSLGISLKEYALEKQQLIKQGKIAR